MSYSVFVCLFNFFFLSILACQYSVKNIYIVDMLIWKYIEYVSVFLIQWCRKCWISMHLILAISFVYHCIEPTHRNIYIWSHFAYTYMYEYYYVCVCGCGSFIVVCGLCSWFWVNTSVQFFLYVFYFVQKKLRHYFFSFLSSLFFSRFFLFLSHLLDTLCVRTPSTLVILICMNRCFSLPLSCSVSVCFFQFHFHCSLLFRFQFKLLCVYALLFHWAFNICLSTFRAQNQLTRIHRDTRMYCNTHCTRLTWLKFNLIFVST